MAKAQQAWRPWTKAVWQTSGKRKTGSSGFLKDQSSFISDLVMDSKQDRFPWQDFSQHDKTYMRVSTGGWWGLRAPKGLRAWILEAPPASSLATSGSSPLTSQRSGLQNLQSAGTYRPWQASLSYHPYTQPLVCQVALTLVIKRGVTYGRKCTEK